MFIYNEVSYAGVQQTLAAVSNPAIDTPIPAPPDNRLSDDFSIIELVSTAGKRVMKVSIIIPAYNEEKSIGANLEILGNVDGIDEIIVVDDGSTDGTALIAGQYPYVRLVSHDKNRGKYQAVLSGVNEAKNDLILFYDADLTGMRSEYVEDLINEFSKSCKMVIMDKGSQSWIFRKLARSLPAQSGTRIMTKKDFYKIDFGKKRSFDLEPSISRYFIQHDLSIGFVEAAGSKDPRKSFKYSFFRGVYLDLRTVWQVSTCFGVLGLPKVISDMWMIERMYRLGFTKPSQSIRRISIRNKIFFR